MPVGNIFIDILSNNWCNNNCFVLYNIYIEFYYHNLYSLYGKVQFSVCFL